MVIPEKSRDMIRLLQERILSGLYSSGQRLPSIRMLMSEFALSNGSVKKGIDYLVEQGLLETMHGSGTFVRRSSPGNNRLAGTKSIAVFGAANPTSRNIGIYPSVLLGMMRSAEQYGCQLQLNPLPIRDVDASYINARSVGTDGAVFLGEIDNMLSQVTLGIPAIGVCTHLPVVTNMSLIDMDPFNSAMQSVEFFNRHELNEIEVISPLHPAYRCRAVAFSVAWQNNNGSVREHYLEDFDEVEFLPHHGYLFSTCSAMQRSLASHKERHGLLPDNVMLGLDGKNFMEPSYYPAPAIVLNWEQVGEAAFDEAIRRIESPGSSPRRIYLAGCLRIDD